MQLRAVLFDLWETLINDTPDRAQPRRAWRSQGARDVLARHGFETALDDVQAALDATIHDLTSLADTGRDPGSAARAHLFVAELEKLTERRAPGSAVGELEALITAMPLDKAPRLAPAALETLSAIKARGLATALVCNAGFTTAPHLRAMLAHDQLLPQLDALVFSDELQVAKPDARIFNRALGGLGLEARDCAFVGDNPHTDISGALGAGFFAVQVGAKLREGIVPSARIDGLHQLLPALESHFSVA